jgi:hypothetical protein
VPLASHHASQPRLSPFLFFAGIYDINKSPVLTMKSGETITMEVATHHGGHDYAKMIRGDPALERIYDWVEGQSLMGKMVPKTPGSGVHIITGPVAVEGAMPGDVVQIEILAVDPRPNPLTGKTYGSNSQKFAGYQFKVGHADGTAYSRDGGHEYITVFEFVETAGGKMAWAKPVSMYMFPTGLHTHLFPFLSYSHSAHTLCSLCLPSFPSHPAYPPCSLLFCPQSTHTPCPLSFFPTPHKHHLTF